LLRKSDVLLKHEVKDEEDWEKLDANFI
jgi:hypothetical protein